MIRWLLIVACVVLTRAFDDGTNIQIDDCVNGQPNQQFAAIGSDKTIRCLTDNKCLDVGNYGTTDGSNVWLWDYHGSDTDPNHQNQEWQLNGDGTIVEIMSGKCLEAQPNVTFYANVQLWTCNGGDNQKWTYNSTDHTWRNRGTNQCMEAQNNNCTMSPFNTFPYCNYSLDAVTRANDLVSRMTLTEKVQNMQNANPGVSRLGVPAIVFSECLHGVVSGCGATNNGNTGCPTSFPHALALAATFNSTLWRSVGTAISDEARGLHSQGVTGIMFWSPDINEFRDPRWGRGQEVPGEDPFLTGEYVQHYSRGLQEGPDTRYLKIVSTAKHYADYDLEGNYGPADRGAYNAIVSDQDQVNYYWPAFRAAVEGAHVQSIMCSYNAINGMPACADDLFMNQVARAEWQFDGFFVSDCGAISDAAFTNYINQNFGGNQEQQAAQGVLGGCDLECGDFYSQHLESAVDDGFVSQNAIDQSAFRIWKHAIMLGMLDPTSIQTYTSYGKEYVDSPANRQLALQAAQQAIVLLKNDNNVLPLKSGTKIAIIGPHFNSTQDLLSNYVGTNTLVNSHSPLQALQARGANIAGYAKGCDFVGSDTSGFNDAVNLAKSADVALVFIGLRSTSCDAAGENEGCDRQNIDPPGVQETLVKNVVGAGKPTVVILINGGPVAWQYIPDNVPAIVEAFYPGELGGDAIASILYGDVSPAGRLPITHYDPAFTQKRPSIGDQSLTDNGGITYLYYSGNPIWQFGYGLSYTTFSYQWSSSPSVVLTTTELADRLSAYYQGKLSELDATPYKVTVTNTGSVTSDVVVLAFLTQSTDPDAPLKELYGYDRVSSLKPGDSATIYFSVPPQVAAITDVRGNQIIRAGRYTVEIGDSVSKIIGSLEITGEPRTLFSLEKIKREQKMRQGIIDKTNVA